MLYIKSHINIQYYITSSLIIPITHYHVCVKKGGFFKFKRVKAPLLSSKAVRHTQIKIQCL